MIIVIGATKRLKWFQLVLKFAQSPIQFWESTSLLNVIFVKDIRLLVSFIELFSGSVLAYIYAPVQDCTYYMHIEHQLSIFIFSV